MMYDVGSSILYGRMGVCKVEDVGSPPFQQDAERLYYKLRSLFSSSGEMIYIPVDAGASLRPLISSGEAVNYLRQLPQLAAGVCSAKRPNEVAAHYQELLASCEPGAYLLLLKEIFLKQKELSKRGKKLGQVDLKYQKVAERLACEEFAVALDSTPDSVREHLYSAMGAA